ncbi:class F sortase [Kocuria turfanensis]|uniref:class F sortase n=1 Tax=Kocuria turfanensis TaxID=388357 RepID=UPI001E371D04|nr:class F sortase [Kocuria turfanensis]
MLTLFRDRRSGFLAAAAVAALLVTGCAQGSEGDPGADATGPSSPSAPFATTGPSANPSNPAPGPAIESADSQVPMEESVPVSVRIPAIGAQSELLHLGLREDRTLDVPPGIPGSPASWYNQSPTPGERGPAVLLGHVNATDGGPGVFAGLRDLAPGDTIEVAREDGSTAVFTVERAEQYSKDSFDTQAVYGNTERPELRLITCDGYNTFTGEFDDNYVVFATLVG